MKRIILMAGFFTAGYSSFAQLHSGSSNLNVPANAQPVPSSTATEKSASTPKPLIAPASNPVPPIYPGGDIKPVETQRETVFPSAPPSPTQPVQREPLTPIESTNILHPTRPQREEPSRPATRTVPVQRTGRPTGIEQANVSPQAEDLNIKAPLSKPIVSRRQNAPATRRVTRKSNTELRYTGTKAVSENSRVTKKKTVTTKKYKKKKRLAKKI